MQRTIVSFNVNGLRAVNKKGKDGAALVAGEAPVLLRLAEEQAADILCLQETKTNSLADFEPLRAIFPYIYARFSDAKKGYSGVAILSREEPLSVEHPCIGSTAADQEGRVITAEFAEHYIVSVYTPNSKADLARLDERLDWDDLFSKYLQKLHEKKPVVVVGDLNCAHTAADIHKVAGNARAAGFTEEERTSLTCLLHETSLIDTFRELNPGVVKYSWWSMIAKARPRNAGWRIDYVLASRALRDCVIAADILGEYHGSDHCPVIAMLQFPVPTM
jgi:exodeoxyribonuclease-3